MASRPPYQHDCEACIRLGEAYRPPMTSVEHRPVLHDLYYCPRAEFGGSVIARYGHEGSEYASMALELMQGHDLGRDSVLAEGARRAIRLLAQAYGKGR
jgi:hypothetical protein